MEQEKSQKNRALFQQLMNLEDDWENYKTQSRQRRRKCSIASSDSIFTSLVTEISPRGLMSGLQHRTSSSSSDGLIWKAKKSDYGVEEIIRDRRVAIDSGKIKGRQLLEAFEGASEVELNWEGDEEIVCSECVDFVQERGQGKLSVGSCSGSSSLSSEVNQTLEEVKKEEDLKVERVVRGSLRGSIGGRFMHLMAWFAFLMTLFAVVLFSIARDGKIVYDVDEVIHLVPT